MEDKMRQLEDRITKLEAMLQSQGGRFEELIRDIVFFDVDNTTTPTQSASVVGGSGGTVTIGKVPTKFLRGYFRGQVFNFPVNSIS